MYLKTKMDKASQMDPMMMIGAGGSEKGYPMLHHQHHYHLHHRSNGGAPHHQFGQQPLHPGFVLPPKYLSKEEYSSVKSIDDSRASVYFTPRTNGTQPGALTEDENMSQKSIQGTPIHINYLSESLDIPEDMQMMYHEMKPLTRGDDARYSQRVASGMGPRNGGKKRSRDEDEGHWSQNPNRLCGGGGEDVNCDITAAEEMMMRMQFGNLDEDTSEILLHELIQKKLKRDRRNRMRFYDERKRRERQEQQLHQRRSKGVGGNVVADQGPMEGNSLMGGGGLMVIPALKSCIGRSRRPVMASAMDPEFLRLMKGGSEGLPIGYDDTDLRRKRRNDFSRPAKVTIVDEEPVAGGSGLNQQQKKRASGVGVEKADILYHSLGPDKEVVKVVVEKPSKAALVNNAWPMVRRTDEEEEEGEDEDDEMCFGDRFSQRQMFTSKSLPEISRKRGKRRNKYQVGEAGDKEVAGGAGLALLGTSSAEANSSIQMTTPTVDDCEIEGVGKSNEQQTATSNSNSTANNDRLIKCVKIYEGNNTEGDVGGKERTFNDGQEMDIVLNGNGATAAEESIRNGGMK